MADSGFLKCWENIMFIVAIAYSILVMYDYNRSGVHTEPTHPPQPVIMSGINEGGVGGIRRLGWIEEFFERRLSMVNLCKLDLTNWSTHSNVLVNITAVVAILLVIDTIKQLIWTCCRKGNLMYYFVYSDNLYNLGTTCVQAMSSVNVVIPNTVSYPARRVSGWFKDCAPDEYSLIPEDLREYGDVDASACDTWSLEIWELIMFLFSLVELCQATMMTIPIWFDLNVFDDCFNGPTLHNSAVGKPSIDFSSWDDQDQVLVNVSFALAWFFWLNPLVEYCTQSATENQERGCRAYWEDDCKVQNFCIAIQVLCMQCGWAIPTAVGRGLRPVLIWGRCARRDETRVARKILTEMNTQLAVLEEEKSRQTGCCTRDPLASWTC